MILDKRIPVSYWIGLIKWDMLVITMFSTATLLLSRYISDLKIPIAIGSFMGTAIALLLSFKLSQSYDRWWEARKIWGAIVNDSRTLVSQLKSFTTVNSTEQIKKIAYRQIAWCYSLGEGLRRLNPHEITRSYISSDEFDSLKDQKNIPLALLDNQSSDLARLHQANRLNDFQQIQIDRTLVSLRDSMGKSERIKNTVFPKTYRVTLKLFIYIFLIFLAFSLSRTPEIVDIPLLVVIAFPFFLLEKISLKIQDPFENEPSDIDITNIARTIEINIKQLIGEQKVPDPIEPDRFYVM